MTTCPTAVYRRGCERHSMASNTKSTEIKRKKRKQRAGRDRKRELQNKGSTKSEAGLFGNVLPRA